MPEGYPELLSELPASILAYAYAEDDQPVTKHLPRLINAALKQIPLRKNSKLLADEAKAEKGSVMVLGFCEMNTAQQFPVQNICSMLVQQQKEMFGQMHKQLTGMHAGSSTQAGPAEPTITVIDVSAQKRQPCKNCSHWL